MKTHLIMLWLFFCGILLWLKREEIYIVLTAGFGFGITLERTAFHFLFGVCGEHRNFIVRNKRKKLVKK